MGIGAEPTAAPAALDGPRRRTYADRRASRDPHLVDLAHERGGSPRLTTRRADSPHRSTKTPQGLFSFLDRKPQP